MITTRTIQQALQELNYNKNLTRLDAKLMLSFILQQTPTYLTTWGEQTLTNQQYQKFLNLIKQKQNNVPTAYLIGNQEFWSINLKVDENVLIPRADTEVLVANAIDLIKINNYQTMLDLGTGSGAISLAIAKDMPQIKVLAVDNSKAALAIAKQNAKNLKINNIGFLLSNWFEKVPKKFDLIVSNPPYIKEDDPHLQNLKSEPITALVAKNNGLADIEIIVNTAKKYLTQNGALIIEHGFNQAKYVQKVFNLNNFKNIKTYHDFNGNERITLALNTQL